MSNTFYKLYVSEVLSLAKTMVIKSAATADAMNVTLTENGIAVGEDPTTWRYYKNISGRYHSTDALMTVTSLDSLETIEFTVESLQDNRATRKAYAYGTNYYEELVKRYPHQEILIRGILNPILPERAITAADNTILYYNSALVEPVESNLIPKLQQWTDAYFLRWSSPAYDVVDDLYRPAVLACYFAYLPLEIMNIRLENCKTEFAHSYHIWEYLESNGDLGGYRDFFTTKQALWLYRDVKYLQMNAGRSLNQETLIERVMSERGLPVGMYKMNHDVAEFDASEGLYPEVTLTKISRNERDASSGPVVNHTVQNMLSREAKLARDNLKDIEYDVPQITEVMQNSLLNSLPTKILESAMIDSSAGDIFPYDTLVLNEWVHKATHGFYRAKIQVVNPYSGALMSMTSVEAIVVWLYCINKTYGITMDTIPDIVANRVRLAPLPSFQQLRRITSPLYIADQEIQWILENQAVVGVMPSTESFFETCIEIHRYATNQYFMYSAHENMMARGNCEAAVERCYADINCVLDESHSRFEDYFSSRGWTVANLDFEDYVILSADILKIATGQDLTNVKSVREIQGAMIQFMTQMSSYSTQWIQTINSSSVKITDGGGIRVSDDKTRLFAKDSVSNPGVEVIHDSMLLKASEYLDIVGEETMGMDVWVNIKGLYELDVSLDVSFTNHGYTSNGIRNPVPYARIRRQSLTEKIVNKDLLGFTLVYIEPPDEPEIPDIPLEQIITARILNGLTVPDGWFGIPLDAIMTQSELPGLVYPEGHGKINARDIITDSILNGLISPEEE